jgi:predicted metal-binding membrane protein
LLGVTLVAWIVAVEEMRGMDAGPGTDLGTFGWFIGTWVTMMVAMMLPAAMPAVILYARLRGDARMWSFVVGYLLAWTLYGLVAYATYRAIRVSAPSFVTWDDRGPWVAGGALIVAALYQMTPLKVACLRHCRSPFRLLVRGRRGRLGATQIGFAHGGLCVACCTGLMVALFALGVMSLFWMAVVAVVILVEKALPGGERFSRLVGVALVVLGVWVAASPSSVPGLTQPTSTQMGRGVHP